MASCIDKNNPYTFLKILKFLLGRFTSGKSFCKVLFSWAFFAFLFFSYTSLNAQTTIWEEDFESYADNTGYYGSGYSGDYPGSVSKWTLNVSNGTFDSDDYFMVNDISGNNLFEAKDTDGECTWESGTIDISNYSNVSFSILFTESGTLENGDYIDVEYIIDSGSPVLIPNQNGESTSHTLRDDFGSQTISISGLSGSTLQLRITIYGGGNNDLLRFDDILVQGTLVNPTFFISESSLSFGNVLNGNTSSELSYELSGLLLTGAPGNITVTAPANFKVSLTSGSGYAQSISIPYSSPSLASTTIYARFEPNSDDTDYSGNITHDGGGATTENVAVTGNSHRLETFTSSGTFTVPAGVYCIEVEALGAGGGGGEETSSDGGGGGGGGGFGGGTMGVNPGDNIAVTVGAGGAGATSNGSNGSDGGNSIVSHSSGTITAFGGKGGLSQEDGGAGGAGGTSSFTGMVTSQTSYSGGAGGTGDEDEGGAGGGGAGNAANGSDGADAAGNFAPPGGTGGTANGGDGGDGGNDNNGLNGSLYGGGGGASGDGNGIGGDGADGAVIIRWGSCTPPDPILFVDPVSLDFGFVANGQSSELSYDLSGFFLTGAPGNITVAAPSNFEVSLTSGSGFASSVNVPFTTATLSSTTIYVRFSPSASNTDYSGNVTNSGGGATTENVAVSGNSNITYCTPVVQFSTGSITNVTFNTINNTTGQDIITDYTGSISTDVQLNSVHNLSVSIETNSNPRHIFAWIDWNQDGDFYDSGEEYDLGETNVNQTFSQNITVPSGAVIGETRMRVIIRYNIDPGPCDNDNFYGEVEDYAVNVVPECNRPTVPSLSVSSNPACSGDNLTINISGSLNDADHWEIYTGSCGGTSIGSTTSPHTSFTVNNVTSTTTYYVRGEGNSCDGSTCGQLTVNVHNISIPLVIEANDVDCQTSTDGSVDLTVPHPIQFDGSDYINSGSTMLSNRSSFTLEGWIKVTGTIGSRISLFGQNDAIEFGFSNSSTIMCWSASGGSASASSVYPSDNGWHHVAAVGNGSSIIIYIDGVSVATGGSSTSNYGSDTNYTTKIGSGVWDASGGTFPGQMIKVGFWSRALSVGEISSLASGLNRYTGSESGLLAAYNFEEGTGTSLSSVTSGTDGTFAGTPTWQDDYTYAWTKSGDAGFSETTQDLTDLGPGDYTVVVTNNNLGCSGTDSGTVGVRYNPVATANAAETTICAGENIGLSEVQGDAVSWNWTGPNSFSSTLQNPTITSATILASGTYTVTITDANGCTDSDEVTVTVNVLPANNYTVSDPSICSGDNATITISGSETGVTYQLRDDSDDSNVGSAVAGTGSAINLVVSPTVTTTYNILATNTTTNCYAELTDKSIVTVADDVSPTVASCPSDINVNVASGTCGAVVTYTAPTFADNCDGSGLSGTLTAGLASGSTFSVGTTTVTYQYTDVAGNGPVTCSFDVTVTGNEAPRLDCPVSTVSLTADLNLCTTTYDWEAALNIDACNGYTLGWTRDDGVVLEAEKFNFAVGTTVVDIIVTDNGNGLQTSCEITVFVDENPDVAPTITAPDDVTVSCMAAVPAQEVLSYFETNSLVDDNCGYENSSFSVNDVIVNNPDGSQTITRTYSISDYAGNSDNDDQIITVTNDLEVNASITITPGCAGELLQITATTSGFTSPTYQWQKDTGSGYSNISGATTLILETSTHNEGDKFRLEVTEGACSAYSSDLTLTYDDQEKPVFDAALDLNTSACIPDGQSTTTVTGIGLTNVTQVSDNCTSFGNLVITYVISGATTANSPSAGQNDAGDEIFNVGTSTVVYTVKDESDNEETYSFDVVVNNNPSIGSITTDGSSGTDGSGYRPYQGTQHTYSVTDEAGFNYTWRVENSGSTDITSSLPNTGQGSADFTIIWDADAMPGNYTVFVVKENQSTGCNIETSLPLTVLNGFNIRVQDFGDACHEVTGSTIMDFVVEVAPNPRVAPQWSFDWNLYLDGGGTPVQTGSVNVSAQDSYTVSITVNVGDGSEKNYRFEVTNGADSLGNTDNNSSDNEDLVKIFTKPTIGF